MPVFDIYGNRGRCRVRVEEEDRQHVFLRGQHDLEYALYPLGARDRPRNLWNNKPRRPQFGMSPAVSGKRSCQLLRRSDSQVADDAAMHGVWIIEAENLTHEIRTVRCNQVPALTIGSVVEHDDQFLVLLRSGLNLKGVDRTEV